MNGNSEAGRGDLQAVLVMVRRGASLVVIGFVVGIVVAFVISEQQEEKYESSALLLFRPLLTDVQATGLPRRLLGGDPVREAETNLGLVALPEVRARAAARLGAGYTASSINDQIQVHAGGRSSIVEIKASATRPETAARVANTVAAEFITFRREGLRDQVRMTMARVRAQLRRSRGQPASQRRVLRDTLQKLQLLGSAQSGDVQLVERATPSSSPVSPKIVLNSVIGGVLGLLLGVGFAVGAAQMDARIRRPEDLEDGLGLPLLTAVPRSKALRKADVWRKVRGSGDVEAFRRLRANLRYSGATTNPIRSVVVTSPGAESGKTTVALHLAASAAAAGHGKVLLVEADLRRPRLARLLRVADDSEGLSACLGSTGRLDDESIPGVLGTEWGFDALVAGPTPADPAAALDSERMRELLRIARHRYDLIVIDAPPPTFVADAIPLMKQADGVILVGRVGRDSTPALERLRSELNRLAIRPLGTVANFSPRSTNASYASAR